MNELTCRDVVEVLMDYLDGDLTSRQREEFEAHLAVCNDCAAYLRQYEETVRLGRAAFERLDDPGAERVPPALVRAILAARRKDC